MAQSFGDYSKYYDLLYKDKDYAAECDFIEQIFKTFSPKPVKTVLDMGCGTGSHAVPWVRRSFDVTGIDSSEVSVGIARNKAQQNGLKMDFHVMDIRDIHLNKTFDACTCMFAVMNYLTGNADIRSTLAGVRKHLKKDSLFVFDCWNGLAVLRILPSITVKTVVDGDTRVIRIARPELDAFRHLCRVNYHLIASDKNEIVDEVEETHVIRYFFPQEITGYLEEAGFEVLNICPFMDINGKVDENVWNIAVIAKAK